MNTRCLHHPKASLARQYIIEIFIIISLIGGCNGNNNAPEFESIETIAQPEPVSTTVGPSESEAKPKPVTPAANTDEGSEISPPADEPDTGIKIHYGNHEKQFGFLYLPKDTGGKLPVVIMIHGGCWNGFYTHTLQTPLSLALVNIGYAVWNIEYRSLGTGGEWPTLFQDVAAATDYLRELSQHYDLDLNAVATMGHSAGGHLALWLASRHKINENSELHNPAPLPINGVVSLAGIGNLKSSACGSSADRIIDRPNLSNDQYLARLNNTSPIAMLPTNVPTILISGSKDVSVPAQISQEYVNAAIAAGDFSEYFEIDNAGHFYVIDPLSIGTTLLDNSLSRLLEKR